MMFPLGGTPGSLCCFVWSSCLCGAGGGGMVVCFHRSMVFSAPEAAAVRVIGYFGGRLDTECQSTVLAFGQLAGLWLPPQAFPFQSLIGHWWRRPHCSGHMRFDRCALQNFFPLLVVGATIPWECPCSLAAIFGLALGLASITFRFSLAFD